MHGTNTGRGVVVVDSKHTKQSQIVHFLPLTQDDHSVAGERRCPLLQYDSEDSSSFAHRQSAHQNTGRRNTRQNII